ncbi:MAG: phosphoribosylamine--glycine ligase [Planctomycetota bacterium]|jgi:phosphoribosylamine--glycine ligase
MKVLIVGGGGREHALAWKISQSPRVDKVYVAPGNAGTAGCAENVPIGAGDINRLLDFARKNEIGLTVVGPEAPLTEGIVDKFKAADLRIFGPDARAARLEGSKVFAKELMKKHGIPSASFTVFDSYERALAYVEKVQVPVVLKASGLAAGKGVEICKTRDEAKKWLHETLIEGRFGEAGKQVIVEECLVGEEASILAFTDGETIVPLVTSQDHKAVGDGDTGPNTGGMGAYSPAPVVDEALMEKVERDILVMTVHAMKAEDCPFSGILYAGLMITANGPRVLEYNVRFGDPEAQPILARMKSDLVDLFEATIDGTLDSVTPEWDDRATVCVVMAAGGYPGSYEKGKVISGIEKAESRDGVTVFHAGTSLEDSGDVVNSGGRVLGVTALGDTIPNAKQLAYEAVSDITWDGEYHRTDISDKALKRL